MTQGRPRITRQRPCLPERRGARGAVSQPALVRGKNRGRRGPEEISRAARFRPSRPIYVNARSVGVMKGPSPDPLCIGHERVLIARNRSTTACNREASSTDVTSNPNTPPGPQRSKRPIRPELEPLQTAEPPKPPRYLTRLAAAEWRRLAPELHRLGLLTVVDVAPLAAYCQAYARWRAGEEALAKMAGRDEVTARC